MPSGDWVRRIRLSSIRVGQRDFSIFFWSVVLISQFAGKAFNHTGQNYIMGVLGQFRFGTGFIKTMMTIYARSNFYIYWWNTFHPSFHPFFPPSICSAIRPSFLHHKQGWLPLTQPRFTSAWFVSLSSPFNLLSLLPVPHTWPSHEQP